MGGRRFESDHRLWLLQRIEPRARVSVRRSAPWLSQEWGENGLTYAIDVPGSALYCRATARLGTCHRHPTEIADQETLTPDKLRRFCARLATLHEELRAALTRPISPPGGGPHQGSCRRPSLGGIGDGPTFRGDGFNVRGARCSVTDYRLRTTL